MEYTKKDAKSIEVVNRQIVFEVDLLSEKETIEKRLAEINEMLTALK